MARKRKTALWLFALAALVLLCIGGAVLRHVPAEVVWIRISSSEFSSDFPPTPTLPPPPTPTPEPTPKPRSALDYEARELSEAVTLSAGGLADFSWLTDNNYYTKRTLPEGTEIVLQADRAFSGLYLVWDQAPGPWSIRAEAYTVPCGEHGFLHEFVELPGGTDSLTIVLPSGGVLCDLRVFTDGRLPEGVQLWSDPVERADILLFPTHGDDELLFFGPIMPIYAGELGLSVQVAYLTNHFYEPYRLHEQLNGLWTVGVTAYPIFSQFPDIKTNTLSEALSSYEEAQVIAYQVEMLRRFQPQVVIDHSEDGEYGHGVHQLNAYCMKKAVEYAADESYDGGSLAAYGVWDTPKLYLHTLWRNRLSLDYDQPLARFNGRSAYEMAKAGYDQHQSQHQWSFYVYPKGSDYDCSSFGLYRSTVGEDTGQNDLMENLTPYAVQ